MPTSRFAPRGGCDFPSAFGAVRQQTCEPRIARIGLELGASRLECELRYKYAVFHFFLNFLSHLLLPLITVRPSNSFELQRKDLNLKLPAHRIASERILSSNSSHARHQHSSRATSKCLLSYGLRLAQFVSFALLALPTRSRH
jgi:hypothetical protein